MSREPFTSLKRGLVTLGAAASAVLDCNCWATMIVAKNTIATIDRATFLKLITAVLRFRPGILQAVPDLNSKVVLIPILAGKTNHNQGSLSNLNCRKMKLFGATADHFHTRFTAEFSKSRLWN